MTHGPAIRKSGRLPPKATDPMLNSRVGCIGDPTETSAAGAAWRSRCAPLWELQVLRRLNSCKLNGRSAPRVAMRVGRLDKRLEQGMRRQWLRLELRMKLTSH